MASSLSSFFFLVLIAAQAAAAATADLLAAAATATADAVIPGATSGRASRFSIVFACIMMHIVFAVGMRAPLYPLTHSERVGVVSAFSPTPTPTSATEHTSFGLVVVQVLSNFSSFIIFLAPIFSFRRIRRARTPAGYDLTPHLVTLVCCLIWGYYGILKSKLGKAITIIVINFIGAAFQILYTIAFVYYSARPARIGVGVRILFASVTFSVILGATSPIHGFLRIVVVEFTAALFSVGISFALSSPVVRVWRDHDVQHMSLPLTCAVAVSQLLWMVYGLLTSDFVLAIPNAFGSFIGFVQIAVYGIVRYRYGPGGAHIESVITVHASLEMQAPGEHTSIEVGPEPTDQTSHHGEGVADTSIEGGPEPTETSPGEAREGVADTSIQVGPEPTEARE